MAPNITTERFDSWKEIALYLNKDVRTVQRWEKKGLPIHRQRQTGAIFAFRSEIDVWLTSEPFANGDGADVNESPNIQPENGLDVMKEGPFDDIELEIREIDNPEEQETFKGRKILIAAGLVILGIATFFFVRNWLSRPAIALPARVVVLPFENLSDDPKLDYLARGISTELVSSLAQLQSAIIIVVERVTAARYELKTVNQIGNELHVDFVIKGSVRRQLDRVRVNVQLIQVSDQTEIWAKSYEDEMQSVPTVASRTAHDIERRLTDLLGVHGKRHDASALARPAKIGTQNLKPYDDFLHGRYFWSKRSVASMAKGMNYFEDAIAEDPNFAAAYARLADGLPLLGSAVPESSLYWSASY